MSQLIGDVGAATGAVGGQMYGMAPGGKAVFVLFGSGDPNSYSRRAGDANPNCDSAGIGSLFLRLDGVSTTTCLYVKTSSPNGWTPK